MQVRVKGRIAIAQPQLDILDRGGVSVESRGADRAAAREELIIEPTVPDWDAVLLSGDAACTFDIRDSI